MFLRRLAYHRELDVLLADLRSKQEEINHRLNQENSSYLGLFAVFVGTLGALAAATTWASSVPSHFHPYLPSLCLLFAITLLWLPINELHQQINIRLIALYITERLVPEIRALIDSVEKSDHKRKHPLLSWEWHRQEKLLAVRSSNLPLTATIATRFAILYGPYLAAMGYYFTIPYRLTEDSIIVLEFTFLAIVTVVNMIPIYIVLMLSFNKKFQIKLDG